MSGHTPGPWEVREVHPGRSNTPILQVAIGPKGTASICQITRGTRPFSEREANALLIASAPDLLEALKGLDAAIYAIRDDLGTRFPALAEAWGECRVAIHKAEGR